MEETAYNAIGSLNLHWYCTHCDGAASKLYQHCVNLKSEQDQLKHDLQSLRHRVDKVCTDMTAKQIETDAKIEEKLKIDTN